MKSSININNLFSLSLSVLFDKNISIHFMFSFNISYILITTKGKSFFSAINNIFFNVSFPIFSLLISITELINKEYNSIFS